MGFWKSVTKVITAAVVTAAVVYTGGAIAGALVSGAGVSLATAATAGAVAGVSTAVAIATAPKPPSAVSFGIGSVGAVGDYDTPAGSSTYGVAPAQALSGQLVSAKGATESAKLVYGKTRVGGNIVFMELLRGNKDLYMVIALAGHQIDSVSKIYANDEIVKEDPDLNTSYSVSFNGKSGFMDVEVSDGSDAGHTFSLLNGTSGEDKTFKGICCIAVKLKFNQDVFAQGMPNFSVEMTGKNPTSNAATAILDYIQDSTYGLGAQSYEIDTASFTAAQTVCDEDVTLIDETTEKRYTVNGAFTTGETPQAIITKMLTACAGSLVYVGGKWTLLVGEYRTPTVEITEDDIVTGITIDTADSRRDTFNAIKGVYPEPTSLYQPQSYTAVTNSLYQAEDGEQIFRNIDFQCVTSSATCQRLAKLQLEKARQQITVTTTLNLKGFEIQVGDTVQLTIDRYGWDQKEFEVIAWSADMGLTPNVSVTLRETAEAVYDWADGEETALDLAENTNLPDPFDVDPVGVSVSDELVVIAQKVVTKLVVNVTGESTFFDRYEVQAKLTNETEFLNMGQASGNRFELLDAQDGVTYDIRARQITTLGVRSEYTTTQHQVVGKTDPPEDVTNFTGNVVAGTLVLTWTPVGDLDLSHYRLRYSSSTSGATYQNAINLTDKIPRPGTSAIVPARQGTYFIKAVDKLGLASQNPATIVVLTNVAGVENLNLVQTVTEDPDFDGVKDDVVEIDADNHLILDTSINFDSGTGNFDDATGLFDGGGGFVDLEGFYYFANSVDLNAKYTSRLTASIESTRLDYVNTFDDATGLFDAREGEFDGDVNAFDNTDVELQVRTTDDDPAGAPTWSSWTPFVVGDYTARAFEFRIRMTTTDTQATPVVTGLSVSVDMPDRVVSGEDVASGAGAKAITFLPAFAAAPAIGITAQNLSTGDYYEITSKSASGFTITFKNSSGTAVDRTFDYVAKGYGREET